jgi:predicted small secreted protein
MELFKRCFLVLLLMTGTVSLCACHTVEGAGKDIQSGGKAIEHSAQ